MKTINPINPQDFPLPEDNSPVKTPASADGSVQGELNQAADLIRQKLSSIYSNEPDAISEAVESVQQPEKSRSKHQKFMAGLSTSGRSFAEIQTAWHEYYAGLPDNEKHEVWNEFYSVKSHKPEFAKQAIESSATTQPTTHPAMFNPSKTEPAGNKRQSVADAKNQITNRVKQRATKPNRKQHLKSLGFGLSAGLITIVVMLFGFFNERFIAPFITPSKNVSSTPLIADGISGEVGKESKLIIPKINVELPVVYDVKTIAEDDVQAGLERGVVHYPTTSNPGEQGNGVIFGHSSNNILNKGRYKFAFVLLSRLENGDTFYIENNGVRYVYKIFEKRVVSPDEVSVLGDVPGRTSTMALITCDPPGTTINRLVVWGEQISPDPSNNAASTALKTDTQSEKLAGNPDSLWSRIWGGVF